MTFIEEIRGLLKQGQELFALDRKEYLNVYMWARNERKKGKYARITGCRNGEYIIEHQDYPSRDGTTDEVP